MWLGVALFKGWAVGFVGFVAVWAIVVLVSFLAGGDMIVMVEILTVVVVSIMALVVAVNVLKKKL